MTLEPFQISRSPAATPTENLGVSPRQGNWQRSTVLALFDSNEPPLSGSFLVRLVVVTAARPDLRLADVSGLQIVEVAAPKHIAPFGERDLAQGALDMHLPRLRRVAPIPIAPGGFQVLDLPQHATHRAEGRGPPSS
jgi:hypothetical protein